MKINIIYLFTFLCLMSSCLKESLDHETDWEETIPPNNNSDIDESFDSNSQHIDKDNAVTISFANNTATISNPFENKGITITSDKAGVTVKSAIKDTEVIYVLSGTTSDGYVKFYSDFKFTIMLNGVSIANTFGPAINIQSGKLATITLVDKTNNRLVDGGEYPTGGNEDMKATLFSEGQMVFTGGGSLLVYGSRRHGICSDDYIIINSGTITVPRSISDAIHANDNIEINGGIIDLAPSNDGIDCEKGHIIINGGTVNINTTGDGAKAIKSTGDITLAGGNITLKVEGNAYYDTQDNDIKSAAGVKCDANMTISDNCVLEINATGAGGKGISVDGKLTINDGMITVTTSGAQYVYSRNINTAAKAIKSDGDLIVNGGNIRLRTSKTEAEGLESKATLTINDGNIDIEAFDDCINAARHIQINGGNIYCLSATNDGIDSNGTLTVTGGLIVSAGAESPEEGFDCDNSRFSITGGTLIGIGGNTSNPTANYCTQRSLVFRTSTANVNVIRVESTSDGKDILTFKLPKTYRSTTLLFSSPAIAASTGYTIYTGGNIAGGTDFHGYYTGAAYSNGSSAGTFTTGSTAGSVSTVGNNNSGPGGGGRW